MQSTMQSARAVLSGLVEWVESSLRPDEQPTDSLRAARTAIELTPQMCQDAGREAGNANMRANGRTEWNDEDYVVAAAERGRLWDILDRQSSRPAVVRFNEALWHEITGDPQHLRDLEAFAQVCGFDVSWPNRQGTLWTISIYCTPSQIEALERRC
jgi:hypothetical protein